MVICIIALPIFAILSLFSVRYRTLTAEAFRCLFRTVQLKPCDTGLDQRIKSKFTAKLLWWPAFARFFYKNFTFLSWIFTILMLLSAVGVGYGLYNYFVYGNCNGPDSSAFCVFNVVHSNQASCSAFGAEQAINIGKVKLDGPVRGDANASIVMHEYGCYSCPYTKEAEPVVREVLDDYPNVKLIYHDVPLEIHNYSIESGEAAFCAGEQGKYWEYHDMLFDKQSELNAGSFVDFAGELDLNITRFNDCLASNATKQEIAKYRADALEVGIYGTPTFVIGNNSLVGPQKYKTFKSIIESM